MGGGGGGGTPDAGVPTAITAPAETWTWVGFPDAVCGNGEATGLGVNLTTRSTDVFLYLQGGGACWERLTCLLLNTASNLQSGYTRASFEADTFTRTTALSRTAATSPFRDMSWVYVPYCTGDVHAGDAVRAYDSSQPNRLVHHKGGRNMEAYLRRLALTFPGARRIYLSGSSAGAYGAQLNYERVVAAFPAAEVHVLADSGQMVKPSGSRLADWLRAWNLPPPAGCPACATDFTAYPRYLATQYPARRFALLAYEQDSVLRAFFGYTAADYSVATRALLVSSYEPRPNARYFVKADAAHTMLGSLETLTGPAGASLSGWLAGFVDAGPAWVDLKP
jgi:hypothetical protein